MRDRLNSLAGDLGETKHRRTTQRLIVHAHSLGPIKSTPLLEIKHHGIEISGNVTLKLRQAGFALRSK